MSGQDHNEVSGQDHIRVEEVFTDDLYCAFREDALIMVCVS